ncbi:MULTISPECIES: MFS transporter [unclassified Nocardiopsis]|uniref:MFS transporter n=1 Tax=unclassified Nocardiopsis TaxID=2649073 RepID=UPI001358C1DF|nr:MULTISPECIES: MFS transporter [unclassified Nocardiopsis]
MDATEDSQKYISSVQRRTIVTLFVVYIVAGCGGTALLSVAAISADELTNSESLAGLATTMSTLGGAVLALPLAKLAAFRGRRISLSLGWGSAALGSLTALAGAHVGSFPGFLLGMALFGAGTAAAAQAKYAAIDLADDRNRGRTISIVFFGTTFGVVIGPNLTVPGAEIAGYLGVQEHLGVFLISSALCSLAAIIIVLFLRPDPLLLSRVSLASAGADEPKVRRKGYFFKGLKGVARSPRATAALVSFLAAHAAMTGVMTMTPVHMMHGGSSLSLVGFTISIHVAGMYVLSPLVGVLADWIGRGRTIACGSSILLVALLISALAGHDSHLIMVSLTLLGIGWSFNVVAGTTFFTESLDPSDRPAGQGVADLLMSLVGASAAALSGVVLSIFGFAALSVVSLLYLVPVAVVWLLYGVKGSGSPPNASSSEGDR